MTARATIILPLLLAATLAIADEKPAPQAAASARPGFDLKHAAVKKIVRETAVRAAAAQPEPNAEAEPANASAVAARIGTLPMRKSSAPVTMNCGGIAEDCAALDANGNELYRLPRSQVFGTNLDDPASSLPCLSSNNLLSTFDRVDRCRGVGLLLPTPWDKVNFTIPVMLQR